MRTWWSCGLVTLGALTWSSSALAAGFAVAEQGASSLGAAGAQTGVADSVDVGFYNPSALAVREGAVASVGASLVLPSLGHTDEGVTTKSEPHVATPPYAGVGYGHQWGKLGVGGNAWFGVPFGAGLFWPSSWSGRYEVTSIELQVFEVGANLALAYRFGELELAIAGGPRFQTSTVALKRKIDAVDIEGDVEIAGDGDTWGWQTSMLARWRGASLGANWRSGSTIDFVGAADFEGIPLELSGKARDQAVATTVELPNRLAVGGAYDHGSGVASLDVEWFQWSSFSRFGIDFSSEETPDVDEPRDWENTFAVRLGYEYRGIVDGLAVRGGFAWDPTPSPAETLSPTLPDSDRFVLTAGGSYTLDIGIGIHLAYGHVFLTETQAVGEEVFPGSYSGGANLMSFGLSYDM